MNTVGLVLVVAGVFFLIYSIKCKNKVNIYSRNSNLIIVNKHKFLKLQLWFSILNSLGIIIFGLIVIIYNFTSTYIILSPVLFTLINSIVKPIGRIKKYIKYE